MSLLRIPSRIAMRAFLFTAGFALALVIPCVAEPGRLERVQYNHPGLVVDLGVGLWAWPLPMDFNGDGRLDLVVSCPDKPYKGVYVGLVRKMRIFEKSKKCGSSSGRNGGGGGGFIFSASVFPVV